ncbi:class I SAM-dependent methyltransferase [Candidatus Lokiarchaeum ossiferum]|uniref:class I SAM-dependent methyltransferase n=1 Tax=Candidatus Lokiarchaeum ossiferum TaxID=2951803 RepID=UPI00352C4D64
MSRNPTKRFSNRVENYVKYRPDYPQEIIDELHDKLELSKESVIADIGSGTGKFTQLLVEKGYKVYGVEPNREMREAGEKYLHDYPNFSSIAGQAEATTLSDHSIDLITAAQAFHWFDLEKTKPELNRILKPNGHLAYIWNERDIEGSKFHQEYDAILNQYCPEYPQSNHRNRGSMEISLFIKDPIHFISSFTQHFDYKSLEGRLFSSSYTPKPGNPDSIPLKKELKQVFKNNAVGGKIEFKYISHCFYGVMNK